MLRLRREVQILALLVLLPALELQAIDADLPPDGAPLPSITQSSSLSIVAGNSVNCTGVTGNLPHSFYRAFTLADFNPPLDALLFHVENVTVGIEAASSGGGLGQLVTLRLYDSSANPPTRSRPRERSVRAESARIEPAEGAAECGGQHQGDEHERRDLNHTRIARLAVRLEPPAQPEAGEQQRDHGGEQDEARYGGGQYHQGDQSLEQRAADLPCCMAKGQSGDESTRFPSLQKCVCCARCGSGL